MICWRQFRPAILAGLLALAACAGPPVAEQRESGADATAFDQELSLALLAEAREAEASGRIDGALSLYREAALAWPDNVEAWRGLGALAGTRGLAQEQAAAAFMIERATLYPSDQLYVQREVNRALESWIATQRALPDANPLQIAYADTLSDFYDWHYAQRGTYVPPSPFLNVEAREIPAVLLSAGGLAGYIGSVAIGGGTSAN